VSISTKGLYEWAQLQFGQGDNERFRQIFVNAVNDVSLDLKEIWIVQADITRALENLSVDAQYIKLYQTGLRFYMQQSKELSLDPDTTAEVRYKRSLAFGQTLYFRDYAPYTRQQ